MSVTAGFKPVLVWIHGGAYIKGSALLCTPSELVTENDVIVVVIQYRLGVSGFLSSGDDVSSGNYGLLDQNLAIHLVKDNIRAFGGDPDTLTVFGESAGSASVGFQLLSPYSKGLLRRVVLQSGTPLASWTLNREPSKSFYSLADKMGCVEDDGWLDTMDTLNLKTVSWVPSVDVEFLPRDPADLLHDAEYLTTNDVISRDVMMGMTNEEGGLIVSLQQRVQEIRSTDPNAEPLIQGGQELRHLLKTELVYRYGDQFSSDSRRMDTLLNVLEFFYSKSLDNGEVKLQDVSDAFGDIFFTVPLLRFAREMVNTTTQKSSSSSIGRRYVYLFNHRPASKAGLQQLNGIYHGEDMAYEFDPIEYYLPRNGFNADDEALATTFRLMLANFAKTGQSQLNLQQGSGSYLPEFTLDEDKYLSLEPIPRIKDHLYKTRVALWLDLVPSLVNSTCMETRNSS